MNRVKIFKSTDSRGLEKVINAFLRNNSLGETIQDIKVTASYTGKEVLYIALIIL